MPSVKRPERELRNAILTLLRAHGIACWPTGVGAFPASYNGKQRFVRVGTVGMSDIIGVVGRTIQGPSTCNTVGCVTHAEPYIPAGRFLAVEVKQPGGKVSLQQTAFLQTVVRAGGIGFVAHSCEEVIEKLGLTDPARGGR